MKVKHVYWVVFALIWIICLAGSLGQLAAGVDIFPTAGPTLSGLFLVVNVVVVAVIFASAGTRVYETYGDTKLRMPKRKSTIPKARIHE